ncbi:MAG: InlB B-repeat-containing protein, partial [Spirochaetes bacterium]|nr:InlB B-repeat-containing protein [Spirochaetota bacterium]
MTRNISKFGLLLLTVVITLTCSSPLVPVLGTVVLDFSSGSRAVGIPAGLTTFNVEVKAPDMATITVRLTAPDLSTVIELPSGADRQFYVTAADSAGKIRYQGKAQLEVVPGATHDLDITMSPVFRVNYLATGAGSGLAPVDAGLYSAGDSATVLGNSGNLTKAGYTFAGWNTAEDGSGTAYAVGSTVSLVDADINLYPRWIPVPYSISYVLNGGVNATGNPATYTIEDTEITLLPPEPWSPYTFLGWYTDTNYITKVISIPTGSTGNRTLYALWDTPTYIVSYDAQGGTTATPPTTSVTYGQIYGALATTSRVGYSFSGWFTEPLGAGTQIFETTTVTITANQTLYAHWVEETYTISYVLNGAPDNGGNPSSYTVSSNITLTAPSWAPYIFEGWYTDIAYTFAKNEILPGETGDITLYAQWAAPTYIVSYDAQG